MATGAAMVAVGAVLGSAAGQRKNRTPPGDGGPPGREPDALEDLADRPVARAALAEGLGAARRVTALSHTVAGLEARVQGMERTSSAERVDGIWNRVLELEQRLEEIRTRQAHLPSVEALAGQVETRLSPRLQAIEARVKEHQAAIEQLQAHAAQTEAHLQKMIAAVEKLAEQISRAFPAMRIEPKAEGGAARPGSGEPAAEAPAEPRARAGKAGLRYWKSLAIAAVLLLRR